MSTSIWDIGMCIAVISIITFIVYTVNDDEEYGPVAMLSEEYVDNTIIGNYNARFFSSIDVSEGEIRIYCLTMTQIVNNTLKKISFPVSVTPTKAARFHQGRNYVVSELNAVEGCGQ